MSQPPPSLFPEESPSKRNLLLRVLAAVVLVLGLVLLIIGALTSNGLLAIIGDVLVACGVLLFVFQRISDNRRR